MSDVLLSLEACIPALRRYALSLLRARQDADDLVHDTLERALDKLPAQGSPTAANPRAWLFAIMHNVFVSQLRRPKVRAALQAVPPDDGADRMRPDQEDRLGWRELLRALDSLPVEQRQVILLVSVEDLSYAEVACVLGVPIGTVMSRLSRGRERLLQMTRAGEPRAMLRMVK